MSLRIVLPVCLMIGLGVFTQALRAQPTPLSESPELEALFPTEFGDWQLSALSQIVAPLEEAEEVGTATLYRTYENSYGDYITLVVAYGHAMGDAVRLHNPVVCYKAQGYRVSDNAAQLWSVNGIDIPVKTMLGDRGNRAEQVVYWMRVGNRFANGELSQQMSNLLSGRLKGADSALVRVSVPSREKSYAEPLQKDFMAQFVKSLNADARKVVLPAEREV